jgi:hypothetical protein
LETKEEKISKSWIQQKFADQNQEQSLIIPADHKKYMDPEKRKN